MSKQIPLTQGKFALVDDEDFDTINKSKWTLTATRGGEPFYAVHSATNPILGPNHRRTVCMHRVIMGVDGVTHPFVDHINHDGLDNRRDNLRLVTQRENMQNKRKQGTSPYKGVSWNKKFRKWQAQIQDGSKAKNLGRYVIESDAARAYDNALVERGLSPVNFK